MKYKDGVIDLIAKYKGGERIMLQPSPEVVRAMKVAEELSMELTGKDIVITSVLDGIHMKSSLHYTGEAFDIRSSIYIADQIKWLCEALQRKLGHEWEAIYETTHIHVEKNRK